MKAGTTTTRMRAQSWRNWSGLQRSWPTSIERPTSESELVSSIQRSASAGESLRLVGGGLSCSDIVSTSGRLVSMDAYNRLLNVDVEQQRVTVQAGMRIDHLCEQLAPHGLAISNLGDVAFQTVGGAIATGTHGTGARFGNLSTLVTDLELVTPDGSIVRSSSTVDREIFQAARVSLGALGAVSNLTLQCTPLIMLHRADTRMELDRALDDLDSLVDENDHFDLLWFPHTPWCLVKRINRTNEPADPRTDFQTWRDDVFLANRVFGLVCRLGTWNRRLVPGLARFVASQLGDEDFVDRADRVFPSPRFVRFNEIEYAIPRTEARSAMQQLRALIDAEHAVSFPVEMRFTAGDDIYLSPAFGRETCYIAVHLYVGFDCEPLFRDVDALLAAFGGRPHWGKVHYQNAHDLAPRFPAWDRFQQIRQSLDPHGLFANPYVERVLGPSTTRTTTAQTN